MRHHRAAVGFALVLFAGGCAQTPESAPVSSDVVPPGIAPATWAEIEKLSPLVLPPPPADISNKFAEDPRAQHLGQELFFDTLFSGALLDPDNDGTSHTLGTEGQTGRVACAGCHLPKSGFLDTRSAVGAISLASGWGLRKAPSLLDVGQEKLLTWDGRRDAFYNQVFAPIESPLEMNSSRLYAVEQLATKYRAEYEALFGTMPAFDDAASFPQLSPTATGCHDGGTLTPTCQGVQHGAPGDGAEFDGLSAENRDAVTRAVVNVGKAIGAYERRLQCGSSPFDAWVHGDTNAIDASSQRGAVLFVGKAGCVTCHSGPYFSDQAFHDVGLITQKVNFSPADYGDVGASSGFALAIADPLNTHGSYSDGDDGRLPSVVSPSLEGAFKTPMLRCVNLRSNFMHTGQIRSLAEVVAFFVAGADHAETGKSELEPLDLTADDQADLVSFMMSLAGPGPDADLLAAPP